MAFIFNGTTIPTNTGIVRFNGIDCDKVVFNGATVWEAYRVVEPYCLGMVIPNGVIASIAVSKYDKNLVYSAFGFIDGWGTSVSSLGPGAVVAVDGRAMFHSKAKTTITNRDLGVLYNTNNLYSPNYNEMKGIDYQGRGRFFGGREGGLGGNFSDHAIDINNNGTLYSKSAALGNPRSQGDFVRTTDTIVLYYGGIKKGGIGGVIVTDTSQRFTLSNMSYLSYSIGTPRSGLTGLAFAVVAIFVGGSVGTSSRNTMTFVNSAGTLARTEMTATYVGNRAGGILERGTPGSFSGVTGFTIGSRTGSVATGARFIDKFNRAGTELAAFEYVSAKTGLDEDICDSI